MNEKFIQKVNQSKMKISQISKQAGIPYTTVSELYHGKASINKVSAETALKLSMLFECQVSDLLDEFSVLAGYTGKYKGFSFKWIENNGLNLYIKENGKESLIYHEDKIFIDDDYNLKKELLTKVVIDAYESKKKAESLLWEHTT